MKFICFLEIYQISSKRFSPTPQTVPPNSLHSTKLSPKIGGGAAERVSTTSEIPEGGSSYLRGFIKNVDGKISFRARPPKGFFWREAAVCGGEKASREAGSYANNIQKKQAANDVTSSMRGENKKNRQDGGKQEEQVLVEVVVQR